MNNKKKNDLILNQLSLESLREDELSETGSGDFDQAADDWPVDRELDFNKDPITSYWPDYDDTES